MKERKVVANKLLGQLRRLRLRKGDIVVVRDPDVMHALATLGEHASEFPPHAIVFAANGIEQVSLDELKGLVTQLEKEAALDKVESQILSGD